jgi:hypothetical protein
MQPRYSQFERFPMQKGHLGQYRIVAIIALQQIEASHTASTQ